MGKIAAMTDASRAIGEALTGVAEKIAAQGGQVYIMAATMHNMERIERLVGLPQGFAMSVPRGRWKNTGMTSGYEEERRS